MKKLLLALVMIGAGAASAVAQTRTPHIDRTQHRQQVRMHQGIAQGHLTAGEAYRLKQQQRDLRRTERMAKADGVVTPRERALIRQKQRMISRNMYAMNHNRVHR